MHLLTSFICFASLVFRALSSSCYLSCKARAGGFFAFVKPVFNRNHTHAHTHTHTLLRCESKAAGTLPASASTLCQDDDHVIMITLSIYVPSFIYNCKGFHKLPYQVLPRGEAEPRPHPARTPVTFHVPDHLPPRRAAPNPLPRSKGSQRYPPPTVLTHRAGLCSQRLSGSSKINLCYSLYAHVSRGKNEALGRLGKLPRVARPVRGRVGIQTQVCACMCVCEHVCAYSVMSSSLQPHGL